MIRQTTQQNKPQLKMPIPPQSSGPLLGFDFGTQRIGVAIGQRVTATARPLTTLINKDGGVDWKLVSQLIEEWQPERLVVGIPCHMDGSEHEMTRAARRFGNRLAGRYNLPVETVDERLTSIEAEQQLAESGHGKPAKEAIDMLAAQLILQSWLDQQTT